MPYDLEKASFSPQIPVHGQVTVENHSNLKCAITEMWASNPLKMIQMKAKSLKSDAAWVFILNYGGGLLGGDAVGIRVEVGEKACMVLTAQASQKIYKQTPTHKGCNQEIICKIRNHGLLFVIPHPVTLFKDSSYVQDQHFELDKHASLLLVDWVTSGRISRGETWEMHLYRSINTVRVDNELLVWDTQKLDGGASLKTKMGPLHNVAMVVLVGPKLLDFAQGLVKREEEMRYSQQANTEVQDFGVRTSVSPLISRAGNSCGALVRVVAEQTMDVYEFLKKFLEPLEGLMGDNPYRE